MPESRRARPTTGTATTTTRARMPCSRRDSRGTLLSTNLSSGTRFSTLDLNGGKEDSSFTCLPGGVPRWVLRQYFRPPPILVFLYNVNNFLNVFSWRVIPTHVADRIIPCTRRTRRSWGTRWATGRATRWSSMWSASTTSRGSAIPAGFTQATCASSNGSVAMGTLSAGRSRSRPRRPARAMGDRAPHFEAQPEHGVHRKFRPASRRTPPTSSAEYVNRWWRGERSRSAGLQSCNTAGMAALKTCATTP